MTDSNKIISAFAENPQGFVDFLIANRKLKGNISAPICDFILNNPDLPWVSDFIWLPLMPRTLSIISVQGRCNLACRMCGGSKGTLEYLHANDLETMLNNTPTAELVILVAGDSEPLMNPELPEILHVIKAHGANCNIVTNGHLLNDILIEAMIETGQPSSLNISLDAATPETYKAIRGASLDHVVSRLRCLRDAKTAKGVNFPLISLLMVGMEDNIMELPKFVELAAELKANRVHVDHLNGQYTPGDFTNNPDWKKAVTDALITGRQLNVAVQLPSDTSDIILKDLNTMLAENHPQMHSLASTPEPAQKDNDAKPSSQPRLEPAAQQEQPKASQDIMETRCPWTHSVQVELDGTMKTCCNMPTVIGNIFDGALQSNLVYLKTRMQNMAGKIHKVCMGSFNCSYVFTLREKQTLPQFIDGYGQSPVKS